MRRKKIVIIFVVLMLLLYSCGKGGNDLIIEASPSNKSLPDLASKIYNEQQLLEILRFDGQLKELNAKYPIDCVREDNGIYRVSYLGDDSIAVILFDSSGGKLYGNIYSTKLLKSDFDGIKKGQLLEDVEILDPEGVYLFLYTGRNDTPRESSHYTKDGYLITIEYDTSNVIINIKEELI